MEFIKLNIQLFASDSVSKNVYAPISSSYPYTFTSSFTENNTDLDLNTSNVTIKGKIYGKNIGYSSTDKTKFAIYWYDNNENQNGKLVKEITLSKLTKGTSKEISATIDVRHLSDGSLKGKAKLLFKKDSGKFVPPTTELYTREKELTTIPRASKITVTSANIGEAATININKSSSNFTTTLKYEFFDLKGTIVEKTNQESYGWIIPNSFYSKIPDNPIGKCKIIATTYNGDKIVGDSSTIFNVSVNEALNKPKINILDVVDTNPITLALTGNEKTLINLKSNAMITIETIAQNYATIVEKNINGFNLPLENNKLLVKNINFNKIIAKVKDSRGFPNTSEKVISNFINYIPLTLSAEFERESETSDKVNLSYSGSYFNDTFGKVHNDLKMYYSYKEKNAKDFSQWIEITPNITENQNSFSGVIQLKESFNYEKAYSFKLTIEDKLTEKNILVYNQEVSRGVANHWWDDNSFNIEVDLYVKGKRIVSSEIPVGSPFYTELDKTPEEILGYGTWERFAEGRFVIGYDPNDADFNTVLKTGGSKELQAHTHTGTIGEAGTHSHFLGGDDNVLPKGSTYDKPRSAGSGTLAEAYKTNETGNHTHSLTINSTGEGNSGNVPPYIVLYAWIRKS